MIHIQHNITTQNSTYQNSTPHRNCGPFLQKNNTLQNCNLNSFRICSKSLTHPRTAPSQFPSLAHALSRFKRSKKFFRDFRSWNTRSSPSTITTIYLASLLIQNTPSHMSAFHIFMSTFLSQRSIFIPVQVVQTWNIVSTCTPSIL